MVTFSEVADSVLRECGDFPTVASEFLELIEDQTALFDPQRRCRRALLSAALSRSKHGVSFLRCDPRAALAVKADIIDLDAAIEQSNNPLYLPGGLSDDPDDLAKHLVVAIRALVPAPATETDADWVAERLSSYRVWRDERKRDPNQMALDLTAPETATGGLSAAT